MINKNVCDGNFYLWQPQKVYCYHKTKFKVFIVCIKKCDLKNAHTIEGSLTRDQ